MGTYLLWTKVCHFYMLQCQDSGLIKPHCYPTVMNWMEKGLLLWFTTQENRSDVGHKCDDLRTVYHRQRLYQKLQFRHYVCRLEALLFSFKIISLDVCIRKWRIRAEAEGGSWLTKFTVCNSINGFFFGSHQGSNHTAM